MFRRETSLIFKPLNALEASTLESTLPSETSRPTRRTLPGSIHKLPDWLLDSQNNVDPDHQHHSRYQAQQVQGGMGKQQQPGSEVYRVRPLTENSGLGRPLWFQELLQARRHSEVLLPSSFEEEDIVYRLGSMEMDHDHDHSGGSSSDNVDIFMILDDETDEELSLISNCDRKGSMNIETSPKLSVSSPSSRRSSLSKENRKNRSPSQFFDSNDFKLTGNKGEIPNNNIGNRSKSLSLNGDSFVNKSGDNLLLAALNGLDSINANSFTGHEISSDEGTVFQRKDLRHRDSHTAADIDLVSLDEPEMETDFIIPELPGGRELIIDIKSNWGDEDYVGFNGIEIFDLKTKRQPKIDKITCENNKKADVKKLIDGVYRTHDDNYIWMIEYSPINVTRISIRFQEKISIVLIRLWNYNKSRIYSYRGIRYVTMSLDGEIIFKGEIAKALGELVGPPERFGDTILFTTDETILEDIANNDVSFQELLSQNVT